MTLLMKSEYAARHNVRPSAVSNWVRRGLIVFGEDPTRPGKQLVDVEKSDLLVRGTVDQTRGRPRGGDGDQAAPAVAEGDAPAAPAAYRMSGPEAVRMEEARERIIGRRIENEKSLGKLVALADVERRAADRGRMIRERVMAVVRANQERLAAETDPRVVGSLLREEFEQLFARVADEIEADAQAELAADAALDAAEVEEAAAA